MSMGSHSSNLPVSSLQKLPLIHTTDFLSFRNIISEKKISPQLCTVFNLDLTYFFYGRPAYRTSSNQSSRTDLSYVPICLIVEPNSIGNLKAIYPFDTGAYDRGYFKPFVHQKMNIHDFLLGTTMDIPPKIVSSFFGTNKNYYIGEVLPNLTIPASELEVNAYYNLIRSNGARAFDDRRYTIEIQRENDILIQNLNILAVILPGKIMDDDLIRYTVLQEWNATPLDYLYINGLKPSEYQHALFDKLMDFYESKGYL